MKNIATFLLLVLITSISYAFSPDWIVEYTKGKVTHTQAVKIVQAVHKHSFEQQVDPDIIFKIIQTESTYDPKARGGASVGLMQIIPYWHRDKIQGRNLFNVDTNVEVGVRIFKEYLDQSNGSIRKALWRYNASVKKKQYAEKVLRLKDTEVYADIKPKYRNS
jgi:soluble lytic murein transglycosylase-like protein